MQTTSHNPFQTLVLSGEAGLIATLFLSMAVQRYILEGHIFERLKVLRAELPENLIFYTLA